MNMKVRGGVVFVCAFIGAVSGFAGDVFSDWPEGKDPVTVGRRVSDQLLSVTPEHYRPTGFYDEDYDSGKVVPYAVISLWANSMEFAHVTGDEDRVRRLSALFKPFLKEKRGVCNADNHVDHAVFGAVALEDWLVSHDEDSLDLGIRYADAQWAKPVDFKLPSPNYLLPYAERLAWWEKGYSPQTRFWIDDMYMIGFLQTQAYRATRDRRYLVRAAKEMCLYLDKLQRPDGLFDHGPGAPFAWGRGNGWMAAAMPILLSHMTAEDVRYAASRTQITEGYRRMMAALLKHQRADGLWGQLVDDPESWAETSGSAMFAFAFVSGVAQGILDAETYAPAARKAYLALVERIDANGNVRDVCVGTGQSKDRSYYLARPRRTGDPHGQAPLMWLVTALVDATPLAGDIHLIGDSTLEVHPEPTNYGSWGKALEPYLKRGHRIVPHAIGGYSTRMFAERGAWKSALGTVKLGDWMIIQFGHNDQNAKGNTLPNGAYREFLAQFVREAREKGAHPLLATPIVRRVYDAKREKLVDDAGRDECATLRDFAAAMRTLAAELKVPLVDMNNLTRDEIVPMDQDRNACYYMMSDPADRAHGDRTHPTKIGARRYAELFRDDIRRQGLEIAKLFRVEERPQTEVLFFFDTEDYTKDKSNDAIRDIAKIFSAEGIKGNFAMVGYLCQRLVEFKRWDVLEALKPHLVGNQTLYHSRHPDICEMSDLADYGAAYRAVMRDEAKSVGMIEATLGKPCLCAVPPGNSKTYVAMYAYAELGIPFYCDTVVSDPFHYGDLWYANLRHMQYDYTMERLIPGWEDQCEKKTDWDERFDSWAKRPRLCLYMHPNTAVYTDFWDLPPFYHGNIRPWGEWGSVPERKAADTEEYYRRLKAFLKRIKADPRFRITDLQELYARQRRRTPITAKEIPVIRQRLSERLTCIDDPASWSVSDCFQAAVRLLRGETSYDPGLVYGFLEKPQGVTQPTTVLRADLEAAAKTLDLGTFIPPTIRVGQKTLGPADFLFAALETLETGSESVTVQPRDQMGPWGGRGGLGELPKFSMVKPSRWIHTYEFKDAYLSDRLRLQLWTLRHENPVW